VRRRVTKRPWFGPKKVGWGLSPVSWPGWLALAIFLAGFAVSLSVWHATLAAIGFLVLLALVILFTCDPPGGPAGRKDRRDDYPR
jgi:hypothetical protein